MAAARALLYISARTGHYWALVAPAPGRTGATRQQPAVGSEHQENCRNRSLDEFALKVHIEEYGQDTFQSTSQSNLSGLKLAEGLVENVQIKALYK